jgi:hypothetical protein
MAAGLGFKNFASGEVLTAADVNAYLNSQTVMVFADAAARTAAIASPQEGMFSYLKDTNATQYYTGSAWTNLDTTGMVNPMTTTGDTIYSSSGTTPARLGIGSTGQVLTVAGGVPTWATPAAGGGGKVLQVIQGTFSTVQTNSTNTYADTGLTATITPSSATSKVLVIVAQNGVCKRNQNAGNGVVLKLMRGATDISFFNNYVGFTGSALDNNVGSSGVTYLDAPATTSATTYKTQFKNDINNASVQVQQNTDMSTITLLEIGA